jgi:uncharacterized protein (DUF697 family)
MSPSKKTDPTEKKKKKPREAAPRPGTMAHLREVEAQKRLKKEDRKAPETPAPEPAVVSLPETPTPELVAVSVPEDSITITDQKALGAGIAEDGNVFTAHMIIHGAAAMSAAVGGSLAQIPVSGSLAITPIQISMIIALGTLHGKPLDKSSALALLAAAYGPYVGRTVSQMLIGLIPGVGNVIRGTTAFVVTESIGWAAHNILSSE